MTTIPPASSAEVPLALEAQKAMHAALSEVIKRHGMHTSDYDPNTDGDIRVAVLMALMLCLGDWISSATDPADRESMFQFIEAEGIRTARRYAAEIDAIRHSKEARN